MYTEKDYCCPECGTHCTEDTIITSPYSEWSLYYTECDIEFETPDI